MTNTDRVQTSMQPKTKSQKTLTIGFNSSKTWENTIFQKLISCSQENNSQVLFLTRVKS